VLENSTRLEGDIVVWACGPWLARLFGDLVSISITRQELLFFDGGPAWRAPGLPGWCDYDLARYGTADIDALGVKAGIDDEGPPIAPDAELLDTATTEPEVRHLHERFPLSNMRRFRGRSCRYELTPDTHFIAAPHPASERLVGGGGSGHGFKRSRRWPSGSAELPRAPSSSPLRPR
jgi:glycine/D-amino acid oxidase-like deaminating enzyme